MNQLQPKPGDRIRFIETHRVDKTVRTWEDTVERVEENSVTLTHLGTLLFGLGPRDLERTWQILDTARLPFTRWRDPVTRKCWMVLLNGDYVNIADFNEYMHKEFSSHIIDRLEPIQ